MNLEIIDNILTMSAENEDPRGDEVVEGDLDAIINHFNLKDEEEDLEGEDPQRQDDLNILPTTQIARRDLTEVVSEFGINSLPLDIDIDDDAHEDDILSRISGTSNKKPLQP